MAEKEYIERNAVLESISGLTWYSKNKKGVLNIGAVNRKEAYYNAVNVFDAVESVPAADVVEVVRCEKCAWWERCDSTGLRGSCQNPKNGISLEYTDNTDFCSYGERKEQE
ncbi:MAG: hypothetical protein IKB22_05115 [Lentisphaeria bacterium]|nr:hypothetical protein [Lentisphaeria bacterium]